MAGEPGPAASVATVARDASRPVALPYFIKSGPVSGLKFALRYDVIELAGVSVFIGVGVACAAYRLAQARSRGPYL
jgi:hypothetical protein